jgi:hypothetical protein
MNASTFLPIFFSSLSPSNLNMHVQREESYASMFLEIESNHDECNDGSVSGRERETRHRKLRVISAAMTPMTASYICRRGMQHNIPPYATRKLC